MTSKPLLLASVLGVFAAQASYAACPQLEGRYTYHCSTLKQDEESRIARILERAGKAIVNQSGCDAYTVMELQHTGSEVIDLTGIDPQHTEVGTKIKKSNEKKLRFKTVAFNDLRFVFDFILGEKFVTKASIRRTQNGFVLKAKEKSRFLGLFSDQHSKFSCRFTKE